MKYPFYILSVVLAFFIYGCDRSKDDPQPSVPGVDSPLITIVEKSVPVETDVVCGETYDNVLRLASGSTLQMKLRLRSNHQLSQYKIDVHSNFDCHSHGRISTTSTPWKLSKTVDIFGTDTTVLEKIFIPADASAGNYHFMIRLLDATGSEADFVEYNAVVANLADTIPPVVSIVAPLVDSVAAGGSIDIECRITDNRLLDNGEYEIHFTDASGQEHEVAHDVFPVGTGTDWDLQTTYQMPAHVAPGMATFHIEAYDAVNNMGMLTFKVHIF